MCCLHLCVCALSGGGGGGGGKRAPTMPHIVRRAGLTELKENCNLRKKITVSGNPYTYKLVRCTRHNNVHLEEAVPTTNNNDEHIPRLTIAVKM